MMILDMFKNHQLYQKISSIEEQINFLHILELIHPNQEERDQANLKLLELMTQVKQEQNDNVQVKLRRQFNDNLNQDPYPLSDEVYFSISDSDDQEVRKKNYLLMNNHSPANQEILLKYQDHIQKKYGNYTKYQAESLFGSDGYQFVTQFLENLKLEIKPKFLEEFQHFSDEEKKDWNRRYLAKKLPKNDLNNDGQLNLKKSLDIMFQLWNQLYGLNCFTEEIVPFDDQTSICQIKINKDGDLIGIIYGDFMKREGKYHRGMTTDYILRGSKTPGKSLVICNFDSDQLKYHQIKTLFHEMGHGLHKALTKVALTPQNSLLSEIPSTVNEYLIYSDKFRELSNLEFKREKVNYHQMIGDLINSYISFDFFQNNQFIQDNCSTKLYQELTGFSLDRNIIHPEYNMVHLFSMGSTYYKYLMNDVISEKMKPNLDFLRAMEENDFKVSVDLLV